MTIAVTLSTSGDFDSSEYRAAKKLKKIFEKSLDPKKYGEINGEIFIYANGTIFGQNVKDIDIICGGSFSNLRIELKTRIEEKLSKNNDPNQEHNVNSNDDDFILRNIIFSDFLFVIEVKDSTVSDIRLDGPSLKVKYKEGFKNVTAQSENQKYAIKNFLNSYYKKKSSPYICNFIWLTQVSEEGLRDLTDSKDNEILLRNFLPDSFNLRWLFSLACLQKIPFYYSNNPKSVRFLSSFGVGINNKTIIEYLDYFRTYKKGKGELTRLKIEKISKRLLKDQKYAKAIGEKLIVISGRAGTGKTLKLINIAYDLAVRGEKRCLILTYNKALVSDIRRLLGYMDEIRDDICSPTIHISTLHKYLRDMIKHFGLAKDTSRKGKFTKQEIYNNEDEEKKDLKNFIENYDEFLEDLFNYVSSGTITKEDIQSLKGSREQDIYWDYFLVDESQDWQDKEKEILYQLFGHSSVIIADGVDQMVRNRKRCDWKINVPDFQQTSERTSLRQKRNLVEFANAYAETFKLKWKVEPVEEYTGGSIYITEQKNNFKLFNEQKEKSLSLENVAYDFMFLTPPSLVFKGGGFKFEQEYIQNGFKLWDGTKQDIRTSYPTDKTEHRILQYESCRGLEAWCVVCLALDDFINTKSNTYRYEGVEQLGFFEQDKEDQKNEHVFLWSLIPLTRPMDTLIITLNNSASEFAEKLKELSNNHSDFVHWIK